MLMHMYMHKFTCMYAQKTCLGFYRLATVVERIHGNGESKTQSEARLKYVAEKET